MSPPSGNIRLAAGIAAVVTAAVVGADAAVSITAAAATAKHENDKYDPNPAASIISTKHE